MKRSINHNTHPGEILNEEIIEANDLTISEVANMLGVTRPSISNIVNEKAAISPLMALRITKVFGGNAERWVRLQSAYDLREEEKQAKNLVLKPYSFKAA